MSNINVKTHPLAEIIAKKLFNIESVPPVEARRMVSRAIKSAVEYHEHEINKLLVDINDTKKSINI